MSHMPHLHTFAFSTLALVALAGPASAEIPPLASGSFQLFTDSDLMTPGLIGSYVNQSLRAYAPQDDWRITQVIAGTRIDNPLDFQDLSWGSRAQVGLTWGTDANWENFSAQWDGYVIVEVDGTQLATRTDDGSRMWIDLNNDGVFDPSGNEFIDNNWGQGQAATLGPLSVHVTAGAYRIRVQYEEGSGGNLMQLLAVAPGTVRVAYLVPANRNPIPNALQNLSRVIQLLHSRTCEQMERNGFGYRSFRYETAAPGGAPVIHQVDIAETDDYLRQDVWGNVLNAAADAGVPLWHAGEVWLLVPEMHLLTPDGTILGGVALGLGGAGSDGGVAVMGSAVLSLATLDGLADDTPYSGLIVPEIGPFELVQSVSFPWFEGSTISGVVSSFIGATLHEVTHAFGIAHDSRNDMNFHGNVMGNGLRGCRGDVFPSWYVNDAMRISYATALTLSESAYFGECAPWLQPRGGPMPVTPRVDVSQAEDASGTATPVDSPTWISATLQAAEPHRRHTQGMGDIPVVTVSSAGTINPTTGLLDISFEAFDSSGLRLALLRHNGNTIGEMVLSGTAVSEAFSTSFYEPGLEATFAVAVYNDTGRRAQTDIVLTPSGGANRAPRPFVRVTPSRVFAGEMVLLDASMSMDPDGSAALLEVEWDLDGDGTFDTTPTTQKTHALSYQTAGNRLVTVRTTDPNGGQSMGTPIAVRVVPVAEADFDRDGVVAGLDAYIFAACFTGQDNGPVVSGCLEPDLDGDDDVDCEDWVLLAATWEPELDPPLLDACGPCVDAGSCCDLDHNAVRDDACVWCACDSSTCTTLDIAFADLGGTFGACAPDGFANIHDRNQVLICFSGVGTCDGMNIDAGGAFGACAPDGHCNIHDANHALTAFAGTNACSCPSGPSPDVAPIIVGSAGIHVKSGRRRVEAGDLLEVHVFVDSADISLHSYQLDLSVSGGHSGALELIDIAIEPRIDWVFADKGEAFQAVNAATGQMLAGLDEDDGITLEDGGYLATYTYKASKDASGTFVVDVRHGAAGQTYLVAPQDGMIEIGTVTPASIRMGG